MLENTVLHVVLVLSQPLVMMQVYPLPFVENGGLTVIAVVVTEVMVLNEPLIGPEVIFMMLPTTAIVEAADRVPLIPVEVTVLALSWKVPEATPHDPS
jgi:hypothetical protein